MKDKLAVAGGGGILGFMAGTGMKPEHAAVIANWLNSNLGAAGFVSFVFNFAQAVALYFTVQYFARRDDQKRSDVKEAFDEMQKLGDKIHGAMDRYGEAIVRFRIVLAQQGYKESCDDAAISEKERADG